MDIVVDTVENNRIDVPRKILQNQSQASFLNVLYGVIKCNSHFCLITQSQLLNLKMADLGYGVRTSPLLRHHSSDPFLCKLKTW